jgi:hypothetical protein
MTISMTDAAARGILHDGVPTTFPAGSILERRTGAAPGANAAPTGTLLSSTILPATPWAAGSGRTVPKNGTWSAVAVAGGVAGHYRLKLAADSGGAGQTEPRIEGTIAGPVAGAGTATATAGAVTFSTSQAGVVAVGYIIIVAGVQYTVLTFNGTTGATVSGNPTFGASAFTVLGGADLLMDNTTIVGGQTITDNTFAVSA